MDTRTSPAAAVGIVSSMTVGDHTHLGLRDGRSVELPLTANRGTAAALHASVRRLSSVEIDTERVTATVRGTGFRRPFARSVPVSMALGLLALGVPGVAR